MPLKIRPLLALLLITPGIFPCRSAHATLIAVDAATPPCPIIADRKNALLWPVAGQLAKYLTQISGQTFKVQPSSLPVPERAILVGTPGTDAPINLEADGFLIKIAGQHLTIVGGSDQGTAYGVFAFLSEQLGCKWWSYNEETVPKLSAIKLGDLNIQEQPAFQMHDIMSREAQTGANYFQYKDRAKSSLQFTGGNGTLFKLLDPVLKDHPDFLPMDAKGERHANALHLNYLAPGINQALADALDGEIQKRQGNLKNWIYMVGQGDWYGGLDQSPASKQMYQDEAWTDPHGTKRPGLVAPQISMMNATEAIVAQKYPDVQLGTFAYMSTDSPPGKIVPAPGVDIYLPRLRYGITLGIQDAASAINPDAKSRARSQNIEDSLEKWVKIAPHRLFIWEYGANFTNFMKPQPGLRAMAQNLKYYHDIGVQGVVIQSNYVSYGGDLVALKNWIWAKLLWNPNQDVNALLKEFCDGYYGPASSNMQDYVNTLENSVRQPAALQLDEFNSGTPFLTPVVRTKLDEDLQQAQAAAKGNANPDYLRRVLEAGASLEALDLWSTPKLIEKDGKLIRADINPAAGGEYTFPRAQELVKFSRGSGKNEWGTGESQIRSMVAANGGPLYSLQNGDVQAKIAPYQGGALWELSDKGQLLVSHSTIAPGSAYFTPVGAATQQRVEIAGETGFSSWHNTPFESQDEIFSQDPDGTLHIVGTFKQLQKGAPLTATPIIITPYPSTSLAQAKTFTLEARSAQDWSPVKVTDFNGKGYPPQTLVDGGPGFQLRVTMPDKKTVLLDTYDGQPATAYAVVFEPKQKALVTYVWLQPIQTKEDQPSASFAREIKISQIP